MPEVVIPSARDWMSTEVFCLRPETDLFDAIDALVAHRAPAAPVVDGDDRLLGMLTEKDCLRVLTRAAYGEDIDSGTVGEYQSSIRIAVEPGWDAFRVAEGFLSTNFPMLPVVERERLVGVVTRQDMLRGIQGFRDAVLRFKSALESGAGRQADRPRSIESMQRAAANTTSGQLVRLFSRPTGKK